MVENMDVCCFCPVDLSSFLQYFISMCDLPALALVLFSRDFVPVFPGSRARYINRCCRQRGVVFHI